MTDAEWQKGADEIIARALKLAHEITAGRVHVCPRFDEDLPFDTIDTMAYALRLIAQRSREALRDTFVEASDEHPTVAQVGRLKISFNGIALSLKP